MFSALVIDKTGDQKARCVKQAGGLQADSLSQICGGKAEPAAVDNTEKQDQQSGLKNAVFFFLCHPCFPGEPVRTSLSPGLSLCRLLRQKGRRTKSQDRENQTYYKNTAGIIGGSPHGNRQQPCQEDRYPVPCPEGDRAVLLSCPGSECVQIAARDHPALEIQQTAEGHGPKQGSGQDRGNQAEHVQNEREIKQPSP